jgi:hypothetical protein
MERICKKSCHHSTNDGRIIAQHCDFIVSEQKNIGLVILVPVITHHTPIILYCISTLRINMGNLTLWEFIYPLVWQNFSVKPNKHGVYHFILSLHIMNVPVHDFCHGGCELHMCFVDAVQTLFYAIYLAVFNGIPSSNTVCMFVNYWIHLHSDSGDRCWLFIYNKKYT